MLRSCRCGRQSRTVPCRKCKRKQSAENRRPYSGTAAERQMRVDVVETHGDQCAYCGGTDYADDPLVLAHLVAHDDGGPFELHNLRAAHRSCNARAGKTSPMPYA